jgi:hypothetical protein
MEEDYLILLREAGEGDPEGVEGACEQRYAPGKFSLMAVRQAGA